MRQNHNETNVSTLTNQAKENPWIPGSHEDPRRTADSGQEKSQREKTAFGLSKENLPKSEILRSNQEFNEVLRSEKWFHCPWFTIYRKEGPERKVGFAVSKRIKGIVRRNAAKRRLRELYRRNRDHFPGGRLVLMAHPPLLNSTYETLEEALKEK